MHFFCWHKPPFALTLEAMNQQLHNNYVIGIIHCINEGWCSYTCRALNSHTLCVRHTHFTQNSRSQVLQHFSDTLCMVWEDQCTVHSLRSLLQVAMRLTLESKQPHTANQKLNAAKTSEWISCKVFALLWTPIPTCAWQQFSSHFVAFGVPYMCQGPEKVHQGITSFPGLPII